ncbi:MAG: mechanosensitive ion channel [Crocinitomicaceae bacterium]
MKEIENWLGLDGGSVFKGILEFGLKLAIAIGIFIVGFWLAKVISKTFVKILTKSDTEPSLITFLASLTRAVIKVLVVITAITQLGVEMTSFVALLGAAGLAIGMAFSGTLSNFAGGVMILFFKPFKTGDFINVQGEEGFVDQVLIFNTILKTFDNKVIILANGAVSNNTIVNYTKADKRRVDWHFGIAYGDDLKVAKEVLFKFIKEEPMILKDPSPFVGVGDLGDSSVNLVVKAWVQTDDYWDVFYAMNERVYNEFGAAGLNIPFPQMDVHMKGQ